MIKDLDQQKDQFFLSMSPVMRGGIGCALLLGTASLIGGFLAGQETRTWGSILFNLMFFFSLALGGVAFGSMQDVIGALWGRPIKRIHEAFGAFLPLAITIFFLFFTAIYFEILGAHKVYSWIADPHVVEHFHGKNIWLTKNFMLLRDTLALLAIGFLAFWHLKKTTAADRAILGGHKEKARLIGEDSRATLRYFSAPVLFLHSIFFSLICFDLTMSLAPTWFSTLWAGWSFALMMHSLMAAIMVALFALKGTPVSLYISRKQFHDIGKLMHGFTAFFGYLTYAHVLTYWYINMPEETSYFFTRLENPWFGFILAAPILSFVIPFFFLIPKANKWNPRTAIPISLTVLLAHWLNYMLVVIPEVTKATDWQFPWIEIGIFFGFLGLFLLSFMGFAKRVPLLSLGDPLLHQALKEAH